jgi:hypothetical protein
MDLDPAAVEAAGRAVCRDGWDVAAERAVHIGSVRAALTAAYPIIAEAVARATADAIADKIAAAKLPIPLTDEQARWNALVSAFADQARSFPDSQAETTTEETP